MRHKKLYRVLNEVGTDLTAHAVAERALRKLYSAPDTIPVLLQEVKVKVGYLDPETEASLDLFYRQIEEVSSISAEQVRRRLMRGLFVKNSLASLPINAALGKGAWFLMSYLTSRERFRTGLREIIEHNRTNPEHLEQTILQDHESLVRRFRQIQGRYKKPDFAYHSSRELEEITKPSWNSAILKFTDDQRIILSDYYDHFYGGEEQAFQRGLVDQYIDTPSYYVKRTCVDNCNDVVNGDLDKHVDQLNTLTIPLINSKLEKLYRRSNRCDPAYHEVVQSLVQYTASACYRLENLALLLSFLKGVEIHLDRKEMLSAFETRRILQDLQFGFSLDGRYVPGELRVYSGNSVKRLLSNLNLDDTASKTVGLQKESSFDELYVPALSFLNNPIIYYPGLSRNAARRLSAPASSFLREDL